MGTSEIILSFLTFIFGGGGIFTTVLYFRQNKKIKEAEAKKAELEAKSNELQLGEYWNKALDECEEQREYYQKIIRDKDTYIIELNNKVNGLLTDNGELKLACQNGEYYKCSQRCKFRQPPREIDMDCLPKGMKEHEGEDN